MVKRKMKSIFFMEINKMNGLRIDLPRLLPLQNPKRLLINQERRIRKFNLS
jgi:hypothetical protein